MKTFSLESKKYFKIDEAAFYFSVDSSFLKKRMGKDFKEGVHYYKPTTARLVRWDIDALTNWFCGTTVSEEDDELLSKLAS